VRGLKGCKTLNKDPDPKNPIEGKEDRLVWYLFFFINYRSYLFYFTCFMVVTP